MTTNDQDNTDLKPYLDALVSKRRLGFAWLDGNLVARQCFGELGQWIPLGENICTATPLFWGMEPDLLQLQDEPDRTITVPKVGLKTGSDDNTKLSIEIMWNEDDEKYVVTLYNISTQADLDHELAKQVRARRIAEENYQNARRQVNEQLGLLGLIMDHAPAAVAILDHNMKFRFATRNWLKLFALEGDPVIGRAFYEVCPDRLADRKNHENCLQGQHITLEIERIQNGLGEIEWVRFDLQPWIRENGSIGGIIIVADVLTELISKRNELEQKNRELARTNLELEEFTSIVSHDLKSPLRAIKSEAELVTGLLKGSNSLLGHVNQIIQQSDRMSSMLDDLFEYSHINRRSDRVQRISIQRVVNDITSGLPGASGFDIRCENTDLELELPLAPIDLILRNLIENAVTHHDRNTGRISVSVSENENHWDISVTDDGPGIPEELHETVFQPFQTGSKSELATGNGIGLALVKKTVELHGGHIKVDSHPACRRGTSFVLSWPRLESNSLNW